MRNHEGYYDPTAGKAIKRWKKKKPKKPKKPEHLTYFLYEVPGFPVILK